MKKNLGFTLIELLVVIAIIGILIVMISANWKGLQNWSKRTAATNNMRQIGIAFFNYAGDNDSRLPNRTEGTEAIRWPRLLSDYLSDVKVYAADDTDNYMYRHADPLDDRQNNTSYIMNGYNDLGALTNASVEIRITIISQPASTILLGTPKRGMRHFYMDFNEGEHGNQNDVLDPARYGTGSLYVFADGSARFLTTNNYKQEMWLVDKGYAIPTMP